MPTTTSAVTTGRTELWEEGTLIETGLRGRCTRRQPALRSQIRKKDASLHELVVLSDWLKDRYEVEVVATGTATP